MSGLSGLSRPMRIAGVALIGIGVVAAVIGGTVALTGNDTPNNVASSSSSSAAPAPTSDSATPPAASSPASSSAPAPTSSPSSEAPPSPSTPAPQPGDPNASATPGDDVQAASKLVTVRIYNNSTIHGLAARAGDDLRGAGWTVAEVSNYSEGIIPTTTAYFRPGTDEEAAAKTLAESLGIRSEARFEGIQKSSPGVIVIVTNDYHGGGKAGS